MIEKLIEDYRKAIFQTATRGKKLARLICKTVKGVIPDIEWSLGWAEAGIDTICFWSDSPSINAVDFRECVRLNDILTSVFPELQDYIDTPFGIYLTEQEAEKIRTELKQLKDKKEG